MSRTPPRLRATLGPQPMARMRLVRRTPDRSVTSTMPLAALAFGRAIDASHRSDADFFISAEGTSSDPVRPIVIALRSVLPDWSMAFESFDVADVSASLDRIIQTLILREPSPDALMAALHLNEALSKNLVQDDGLSDMAVAKILTYGALEAYYYRRATREAKVALDAYRDLIQLATGHRLDFINQDDVIETNMRVWEGWQAIRGLNLLFGLSNLAIEFKRQKIYPMPALLLGADVILYAGFDASDTDAVEESIAQLELIALRAGRRDDLELAEHARTLLGERLPDEPPDTIPDDLSSGPDTSPLAESLRATFVTDLPVPKKRRTTVPITEDLASTLERYEILIDGDDDALSIGLAPGLQRNVRLLYAELGAHHPKIEQQLYEDIPPARDVIALRMLLRRIAELDRRFESLRDALQTGDLEVGWVKD